MASKNLTICVMFILAMLVHSGCRLPYPRSLSRNDRQIQRPEAETQTVSTDQTPIGSRRSATVRPAAFFQTPAPAPLPEPPVDVPWENGPNSNSNHGYQSNRSYPGPAGEAQFHATEIGSYREKPATERVMELHAENQDLKNENRRLIGDIQSLRRELDESKTRIEMLEGWVFKLQKQLKIERAEYQACQSRFNETTERMIKSQQLRQEQIADLTRVIDELERQLKSHYHQPPAIEPQPGADPETRNDPTDEPADRAAATINIPNAMRPRGQ